MFTHVCAFVRLCEQVAHVCVTLACLNMFTDVFAFERLVAHMCACTRMCWHVCTSVSICVRICESKCAHVCAYGRM